MARRDVLMKGFSVSVCSFSVCFSVFNLFCLGFRTADGISFSLIFFQGVVGFLSGLARFTELASRPSYKL